MNIVLWVGLGMVGAGVSYYGMVIQPALRFRKRRAEGGITAELVGWITRGTPFVPDWIVFGVLTGGGVILLGWYLVTLLM